MDARTRSVVLAMRTNELSRTVKSCGLSRHRRRMAIQYSRGLAISWRSCGVLGTLIRSVWAVRRRYAPLTHSVGKQTVGCFLLREHGLDKPPGIIAELPHGLEMIGVLHAHRLKPVFRQAQQGRIGIGHQDRRMASHDDLAMAGLIHSTHQLQNLH